MKLPDVTLVAFGSTDIGGMKKALEHSRRGIDWGDVKLITEVPCNGIDEWNKNVVFKLGQFIDTPFAMLIHPDGYVVNPKAWRNEFLQYDYIGAPWPLPADSFSYRDRDGTLRRVGNSVSLRSKRLLDLPKKIGMEWKPYHGYTNEDGYICVNMRHEFVRAGMSFAPLEVAKYFSHETPLPETKGIIPFAFHRHMGANAQYPNYET